VEYCFACTRISSAQAIRWLEAHAAVAYFGALRNIPVLWPKVDLSRIPIQWRTVGGRHSPLSGGPRLAVTPFHAVLNYCFALLEAETRLSLVAVGLDPAVGLGLHTDTPNRDSLALDVLEPVRPRIESWLVSWVLRVREDSSGKMGTRNRARNRHGNNIFGWELEISSNIWHWISGPYLFRDIVDSAQQLGLTGKVPEVK
jgi:hypothetical protein